MKRIYLDNAASTPVMQSVIDEMVVTMQTVYGNPSSIHNEGRKARALIEVARKKIAQTIQASVGEIFFTSGGTESNNMAIKCAVRDLKVNRIITSKIEHHCVLHSVEAMEKEGVEAVYLNVNPCGLVDMAELEALLSDTSKRTLVSIMHINNEIGTMQDIDKISELCEKFDAFFHTDTVQTIGHFPLDVSKTKVHFLSGAAHKFHGPKGIGFIYISNEVRLNPFIDGGAQERNMRGGTENLTGIVGMAKALDIVMAKMDDYKAHILELRTHMKNRLANEIDGVKFNEPVEAPFLYTILNVSFPPHPKNEMLLLNLDIHGISASGGSACSSGAERGSHVMEAIGDASNRKPIRFSFSHLNTIDEIDYVVDNLVKIYDPVKV